MLYIAMNRILGRPGGTIEAGQIIDAEIADIASWVAVAFGGLIPNPDYAALSPLDDPIAAGIRDPSSYATPMRAEGCSDEVIRQSLVFHATPVANRVNHG